MKKVNILFFILLPFIDVITALTTRLVNLPVSLGIIIKGLYILVLSLYILIYSKSKYKKTYIYYLISIVAFSLLYFITKTDLLNREYIFYEITNLFKFMYGSILFFGLLVLYDENKFDNKLINKLMLYSLITYAVLLIVPTITNTNFSSYGIEKGNEGSLGWFFAGNDVSAILLMLYPFIYSFLSKKVDINNKKTYLYYLLLIPVIASVFMIGTKTSWIGLILITLVLLIINIVKKTEKKDKLVVGIILLLLIPLTVISPALNNTNKTVKESIETKTPDRTEKKVETEESKVPECTRKKMTEVIKNKTLYRIINIGLSGRQNKAYTGILIYNKAPIADKFFGIGFTDTPRINNCNASKFIEMDIFDIFIHYGIIGLIIILTPFIYVIRYIINNKRNLKTNTVKYIAIGVIMFMVSLMAGHIIGYPSSGIYLTIYLLLMYINE